MWQWRLCNDVVSLFVIIILESFSSEWDFFSSLRADAKGAGTVWIENVLRKHSISIEKIELLFRLSSSMTMISCKFWIRRCLCLVNTSESSEMKSLETPDRSFGTLDCSKRKRSVIRDAGGG